MSIVSEKMKNKDINKQRGDVSYSKSERERNNFFVRVN